MMRRCTFALAGALLLSCFSPPRAAPAAPAKTLRMLLTAAETGFDPAVVSDLSSLSLLENVFDPMLRYDYLARPLRLRENTLQAMPRVDAAGTTYLFRIRTTSTA